MLNPITVHVHITAQPGKSAAIQQFLRGALPSIRTAPGCHGARLLTDAEQTDRILLVEQWASVQRHEAHVASMIEAGMMEKVVAMATEPPRSEYFAATGPAANR